MDNRLPISTSPPSDVEFDPPTIGHSESAKGKTIPNLSGAVPGGLFDISTLEVCFDVEPRFRTRRAPIKMEFLDTLGYPKSSIHQRQSRVASAASRVGKYGRVFKAYLAIDGEEIPVALKFATGEKGRQELVKEAKFYNEELLRVQGFAVPEYIGIFGACLPGNSLWFDGPKTEVTTTCLVLTYVGEALTREISELSANERYLIYATVIILHQLGVEHGDIHEGNIRMDLHRRNAYLVDFGRAEKHVCKRRKVPLGEDAPDLEEFGCLEVYQIGLLTNIWISYGTFTFCNIPVPLSEVDRWEDLVDYTPDSWPTERRVRSAQASLKDAIATKMERRLKYYKDNEWFWKELMANV